MQIADGAREVGGSVGRWCRAKVACGTLSKNILLGRKACAATWRRQRSAISNSRLRTTNQTVCKVQYEKPTLIIIKMAPPFVVIVGEIDRMVNSLGETLNAMV